MTMPQLEVDAILDPLVSRLEAEEAAGRLGKDDPGFWALRAARTFPLPDGHRDRGILSIYLLNLVHLRPGQGTYQPAGTLHAYLEGADVELMANSDNVLRGGLTPKHVDVPELLATLSFRDGPPPDPGRQGDVGDQPGIRDAGGGVRAGTDRGRPGGPVFRRPGAQRRHAHRDRRGGGGCRRGAHAPALTGRLRDRARRRALLHRRAGLARGALQGGRAGLRLSPYTYSGPYFSEARA